jgi:hypothetical protein
VARPMRLLKSDATAFSEYRQHIRRSDQSMASSGIVESADAPEYGTIVRSATRIEQITLAQPISGSNLLSQHFRERLVDAVWASRCTSLNIRLARGVRSTPSGASEARGVSQTFTTTVTAGETRTVARSVVPTPRVHSICSLPPSASRRSPCWPTRRPAWRR